MEEIKYQFRYLIIQATGLKTCCILQNQRYSGEIFCGIEIIYCDREGYL